MKFRILLHAVLELDIAQRRAHGPYSITDNRLLVILNQSPLFAEKLGHSIITSEDYFLDSTAVQDHDHPIDTLDDSDAVRVHSVEPVRNEHTNAEPLSSLDRVVEPQAGDSKSGDVLLEVVGRQLKVPAIWFGEWAASKYQDQEFILDIIEVLPAEHGYNRRLLLVCEDEEYFCARKDFDHAIKPFLVPVSSFVPPPFSGMAKSQFFGECKERASIDRDDNSYIFTGALFSFLQL